MIYYLFCQSRIVKGNKSLKEHRDWRAEHFHYYPFIMGIEGVKEISVNWLPKGYNHERPKWPCRFV